MNDEKERVNLQMIYLDELSEDLKEMVTEIFVDWGIDKYQKREKYFKRIDDILFRFKNVGILRKKVKTKEELREQIKALGLDCGLSDEIAANNTNLH